MDILNILIIQDDIRISTKLKNQLAKHKIKTTIANCGVEAYKILYKTEFEFDYIIINISLPDENGVEIIKFIKNKFNSKIIIYTSKKYEDYKDKCQYDYFLEKNKNTPTKVVKIILDDLI